MQALTSKYEADNTHIHRLLGYIKEIGVLRILQVRKEDGTLARSYRSFLANTNLMASLFREMERVYVGETFSSIRCLIAGLWSFCIMEIIV